jgi:hypothetical protein
LADLISVVQQIYPPLVQFPFSSAPVLRLPHPLLQQLQVKLKNVNEFLNHVLYLLTHQG